MNIEIKAKWVAALRSGDYQQGHDQLRTPENTFCCFGVLCDLHSKETGTEWQEGYMYMLNVGILPQPVANWADMKYFFQEDKLMEMNDENLDTFEVIADYIEDSL